MNVFAGFTTRGRLLMVGLALVAAMALLSLAPTRPVDAQLQFSAPDLKVTSHEVRYLSGPYFVPGYYLVVTVRNTGSADAGPSTVFVRDTNNKLLQTFQMTVKTLGQGAMIHHKLPDPGNCGIRSETRRIVVDATNAVNEWLPGGENNHFPLTHTYGPGPC